MKYAIVHYNTPELTTCLCANINKFDDNASIVIFENSDKRKYDTELFDNVEVIDNSANQLVNFDDLIVESKKHLSPRALAAHNTSGNHFGSLRHAASVQWLLDNLNTDFVLLDSDILLTKSPLCLFNNANTIVCDFLTINNYVCRVLPFMCFMKHDIITQYNLKFFDVNRFDASQLHTDTGGTFCYDILTQNIPYKRFNISEYIVHFGNGSWRTSAKANLPNTEPGNYATFLTKYRGLWQ